MAKKWQYLKPGDTIDIIAPSSAAIVEVQEIVQLIEMLGFQARVDQEIINLHVSPFLANSDEYRLSKLVDALSNPESKAIWCLRGGYGSARLIDDLSKIDKPTNPKLLIGFSDITVLHIFINQKWEWPSLHGMMVSQAIKKGINDPAVIRIVDAITGNGDGKLTYELIPLNKEARDIESLKAEICGGNLALVQTSIGTNWQLDTAGKILFLEEVHEAPYRVDRMLNHMKQAHLLDDVIGIIFGEFISKPEEIQTMKETLSAIAHSLNIPVFYTNEFGHGAINHPLPLGTEVTITDNNGYILLECETGGYHA
jgi:muramoyltetrapeptide carboxypeptidase